MREVPGMFQNALEMVTETFYDLTQTIAGKNTQKIFPWFMSFFLFILLANWSGLIPGMSVIGFFRGEGSERHLVPLFRNATSDLNTTVGLALLSLIVTHTLSLKTIGIKEYLGRFFSLNPINLFVGILELIGEATKVISLSFRLFGNIFAGEVVLGTVASLIGTISAFLIPIPFILLEIIVGLVQALVFSMLTMVFMSILMTPHHAQSEEVITE